MSGILDVTMMTAANHDVNPSKIPLCVDYIAWYRERQIGKTWLGGKTFWKWIKSVYSQCCFNNFMFHDLKIVTMTSELLEKTNMKG